MCRFLAPTRVTRPTLPATFRGNRLVEQRSGGGVTDIEIAVGLLITRITGQTQPGADRVDAYANQTFELVLRAVHELVIAKLGGDPALERMHIEISGSGEVRPRTQARLVMALEDAVEDDPEFARNLERAVSDARTLNQPRVETHGSVINQITGTVNGRVIQARDIHGSVTFHDGTKGN